MPTVEEMMPGGEMFSGANPGAVEPGLPLEVIGSANVVNTDAIPSTNVSQCTDVTVQTSGTWSGTITFQGSNDGTNWSNVVGMTLTLPSNIPASNTTGNGIFVIPTGFKYFRVRFTTYTSGTVTCTLVGNKQQTPALAVGGSTLLTSSSNLAGDVGVQYRTNSTGAALIKHIVSAASTNATVVKASGGRLLGLQLANTTASFKYVKLHNTGGTPTAGAGVVMTIALPPNTARSFVQEGGIGFSSGIGYTIVNGSADNDTTAVAAGDVVGDLFYA